MVVHGLMTDRRTEVSCKRGGSVFTFSSLSLSSSVRQAFKVFSVVIPPRLLRRTRPSSCRAATTTFDGVGSAL